jgi:prepilin-type N-terminal cleavage/methylation domain-containing protein
MKLQNTKLGFTLIELLVVITIIGILATGAVWVYTSQIQKARDTTRINDVKAIQSAVEQFYQDTTEYPEWLSDWTASWTTSVMTYLPNLAEDPKFDQTCINSRCWYVYVVGADLNWILQWTYEISTAFENQWNVDNKAWVAQDNWDDNNRLEIWLNTDINDTVSIQGTAFAKGTADDNTDTLVIMNSDVVTK